MIYFLILHPLLPLVLVICNFRIYLEPRLKILLVKTKVLLFLKLCVEYAFLVKTKGAREQRRCYHANFVTKSITGAAWENGLNIEVNLNTFFYQIDYFLFFYNHQIGLLFSISVPKSNITSFCHSRADLFHWNSWACPSCRICEVSPCVAQAIEVWLGLTYRISIWKCCWDLMLQNDTQF